MFIHYKGTNVHAMGFQSGSASKLNQSPSVVKGLQPGWNEFPKEIWEQNEKNPTIQRMLKKGLLVLFKEEVTLPVRDKKTGKVKRVKKVFGGDDTPIKIKFFDEKRAIEIVKDTYQRDLLQRWIDEESRHKVKRALEKQMAPLRNDDKSEQDEDDDDLVFDPADFETDDDDNE